MSGMREHVEGFLKNLHQPGMPPGEYISKFVRNRIKARVIANRCCGHPGEPGC